MRKQVCVVIPMFGKSEYTRKCVDTVIANAGISDYDILVVDDGSPEPYRDERVIILPLPENSGFTNAANQGILWAGEQYEFVLLLNNDTEEKPDFLKELLAVMEDPAVGIAGSVREYPDGRTELCGADLIRGHQWFMQEGMKKDAVEVNWFPLCSGLLRMSMVREIGILDKRFRNHCSDAELCIRAKMWKWKVMIVPRSIVIHHLSVTTKAIGVNVEQDQRLFIEKLAGLDYALLMKAIPLDLESKTYGQLSFTIYQK